MKKVMLIIRDGWGYRKDCSDNAICQANTPNTDRLMKEYPTTLIKASGEAVGLPDGFQGNSEVGHMAIGGGRIIFQSLVRINKSISDGDFFENPAFLKAIENCQKNNSTLHLIGILQVEAVHGYLDHLLALLDLCAKKNFKNVVIHLITDGRDAPIHDSLKHLKTLQAKIDKLGFGKIASVSGRYFAMDRDTRWERTEQAYKTIVEAASQESFDAVEDHIVKCHGRDETDEFVVPAKASWYQGMKDGDSVIFYNFRTDRTRQLTKALIEPNFDGFERQKKDLTFVAMTDFYKPMPAMVAFADQSVNNFLGEVVAKAGKTQLRISETEKYAHVTFFFNGQIEKESEGEDRIMIPSPKVATYDLKPEMSVYEIKDKLVEEINKNKYDLIVTNLVNGDLVGHTAVVPAIKKACEAVDDCLGQIVTKALEKDYTVLVFADHGNAEDQTPAWATSHTLNPVEFILVSNDENLKKVKLPEGKGLADIAPTVLKLMGLAQPEEMTGESLI